MTDGGKITKAGGQRGLLLVGVLMAVAVAAYLYWSPYQTLHEMRKALKAGQVEMLDQDIDYSAVREGLKRDFRNVAINEVEDDPSIKNRLLGLLGLAIGAPIADTAIDYMVSPAGLRRIVSGAVPILSARSESPAEDFSDDAGTSREGAPKPFKVRSTAGYYLDFNHFVIKIVNVSGSATALTFTRRGLASWQMTHVKLMPSRQ
ncbi:MAG: DUF2939 domain-containing protein [Cyanobacteria bacterium REEB67]|nr:DUF2939 domain-containing protein [Cyanobacteria bacterium REEB67]